MLLVATKYLLACRRGHSIAHGVFQTQFTALLIAACQLVERGNSMCSGKDMVKQNMFML